MSTAWYRCEDCGGCPCRSQCCRAKDPDRPKELVLKKTFWEKREQADQAAHARERKLQEAMLGIKQKFGKNAILSGGSYMEGATARERNGQIGGHKA